MAKQQDNARGKAEQLTEHQPFIFVSENIILQIRCIIPLSICVPL